MDVGPHLLAYRRVETGERFRDRLLEQLMLSATIATCCWMTQTASGDPTGTAVLVSSGFAVQAPTARTCVWPSAR